MPYQFRQTGAEIQDILDQVGENTTDIAQNTTDIAQNTNDISSINTTLTDINTDYYQNVAGSYSVPSAQWTVTMTKRFEPGVYLVEYGAAFNTNSVGIRAVGFGYATGTFTPGRNVPQIGATPSDQTRLLHTQIMNFTSTTNMGIWLYQTSGSALNCFPVLRSIKLR